MLPYLNSERQDQGIDAVMKSFFLVSRYSSKFNKQEPMKNEKAYQ